MGGRSNYDNGFEGVALEFQKMQMDTAEAQLEEIKKIRATLDNMGIIAARIADALEKVAGIETKHTFTEEF